ncbi:MAG: ABC transporter substrate-binding protein [Deltaproteobacteria bacterium]|nr:ABC transporter substrate-binding protein [Deltaproteobacteria bacterium]
MTQLLIVGEFSIQIDGYFHVLDRFKRSGAPVDYVVTHPLIMKPPSVIALAKNAPHPHAAALFIDYHLSAEGGQKILAGQNRFPANRKTKVKMDFRKVEAWAPALDEWLPRQAEVISQFDKIFGVRRR